MYYNKNVLNYNYFYALKYNLKQILKLYVLQLKCFTSLEIKKKI